MHIVSFDMPTRTQSVVLLVFRLLIASFLLGGGISKISAQEGIGISVPGSPSGTIGMETGLTNDNAGPGRDYRCPANHVITGVGVREETRQSRTLEKNQHGAIVAARFTCASISTDGTNVTLGPARTIAASTFDLAGATPWYNASCPAGWVATSGYGFDRRVSWRKFDTDYYPINVPYVLGGRNPSQLGLGCRPLRLKNGDWVSADMTRGPNLALAGYRESVANASGRGQPHQQRGPFGGGSSDQIWTGFIARKGGDRFYPHLTSLPFGLGAKAVPTGAYGGISVYISNFLQARHSASISFNDFAWDQTVANPGWQIGLTHNGSVMSGGAGKLPHATPASNDPSQYQSAEELYVRPGSGYGATVAATPATVPSNTFVTTGSCNGQTLSDEQDRTCEMVVNGLPDIEVTLNSPATAYTDYGQEQTITLTATNLGPGATDADDGFTLQATLPAGWSAGASLPPACSFSGLTVTCNLNPTPLAAAAAPGGRGGSAAFVIPVRVDRPTPGGTYPVTLALGRSTPDSDADPTNNDYNTANDTAPGTLVFQPRDGALVAIDKSVTDADGNGFAEPGEILTYTLTLTNTGGQAVSNYTLLDLLDPNVTYNPNSTTGAGEPTGTSELVWGGLSIPASQSIVIEYTVTVADPLADDVIEIGNIACERSENSDTCRADQTETATPVINVDVDKSVADASGDGFAQPGEVLTYTITLTNNGNVAVPGYEVRDDLDANVTYQAGSTHGSAGAGEPAGTTSLLWNGLTVPASGPVTIVYRVTVDDPLAGGVTNIRNLACRNPEGADPCDDAGVTLPVDSVSVAKSASDASGNGFAEADEILTYTITLTNTGAADATNYVLLDVLDANVTYLANSTRGTAGAGEPTTNANVLEWSPGLSIPAGQSVTVIFDAQVVSPLPNDVVEIGNIACNRETGGAQCQNGGARTSTPVRNVTVEKSVVDASGNGLAEPGEILTYTVSLTNNSSADITDYDLRDELDGNTSYVTGSTTGASEPSGTNPLLWSNLSIPANGTIDITYDARVADPLDDAVTELRNIACETPEGGGACGGGGGGGGGETVIPVNVIELDKTVADASGNGFAEAGEVLTYTLTLTNRGNIAVPAYSVLDVPDANSGYVAGSTRGTAGAGEPSSVTPLVWDGVAVPANGSVTIVYDMRVSDPLNDDVIEIRNIACERTGSSTSCASGSESTVPVINVDVGKAVSDASGNGFAESGEILTYTLTLTNNGNVDVTGYDVRDDLDPNVAYVPGSTVGAGEPSGSDPLNWSGLTIAAGTPLTIRYQVRVNDPLPDDVIKIENIACQRPEDRQDCGEDGTKIETPVANIVVEKSFEDASGDGFAQAGEVLTYTITLTNRGEVAVPNYSVQDEPDPNLTYQAGSTGGTAGAGEPSGSNPMIWGGITVPASSSVTVTYRMTVADPLPDGVTGIGNTVCRVPDGGGSCDGGTNVVVPIDDVSVQKTVVDESGDGVAEAGELLTYTIVLTNTGGADATAYTLLDKLDGNVIYVEDSTTGTAGAGEPELGIRRDRLVWAGLTIPAGQSVTVIYQVRVDDPIDRGVSEIRNTACRQVDNSDDCTDGGSKTTTPVVNVELEKLVVDDNRDGFAQPGELLTYTVTLTNHGAAPANGYRLRDEIDPNTSYVAGSTTGAGEPTVSNILVWDGLTVPANDVVTITYQVRVDNPLEESVNQLRNIVCRQFNNEECEDGDPEVTLPVSRVVVSKIGTEAGGDGFAQPGEVITYTIMLTNMEDADASNFPVLDMIDPNTTYVPGSTVGAPEPSGSNPLVWEGLPVPANDTLTFSYSVRVADTLAEDVIEIRNLACEKAEDSDTCRAAGSQVIFPVPNIGVTKSVSDASNNGFVEEGEVLTYTVTLTNRGNVDVPNYQVLDNLDPLTSYVAGSTSGTAGAGEPDTLPDSLVWRGLTIPAQSSVDIVYEVRVADRLPENTSGIRNIACEYDEETEVCDSGGEITIPVPGVSVEKSVNDASGDGYAQPGETLTYTISLTNTGTGDAVNYPLLDNLDPNTTYTAGTTRGTAGAAEPVQTAPLVWNGLTIPAGQTVTVIYDVEVNNPLDSSVTELSNIACRQVGDDMICSNGGGEEIIPVNAVDTQKSVSDASGDGFAQPGEILTYTITLTNTGNLAATNYPLRDDPDPNTEYVSGSTSGTAGAGEPSGTSPLLWTIASIPAGGEVTVVYNVRVKSPLTGITALRNIACRQEEGANPCDNGGETTIPVSDVSVMKAVSDGNGDAVAQPGETLTYTLTLTNTGDADATGFSLLDVPDANVNYVSGSTGGTAGASEPVSTDPIVWEGLTIQAGRTVTVIYKVVVADSVPAGVEKIANIACPRQAGQPGCKNGSRADIPLIYGDPEVSVAKRALITSVRIGEQVPYVIEIANNSRAHLRNLTIYDRIPSGFRYVDGTGSVNGAASDPTIDGRTLSFGPLNLAPNESVAVELRLVVLSTVEIGRHVNRAGVRDENGNLIGKEAEAFVEVLPEPIFDCGDIIGQVFDDRNRNGYQDKGEQGLPGARVATVSGLLVTSDPNGRFHVACADLPQKRIGSNFIMKLDPRSLPSGYRLTTENPRVVRLTAGKVTKLNFGAAVGRVVSLEIESQAFVAGSLTLDAAWNERLRQLVDILDAEHSVLRVVYRNRDEDRGLARRRLQGVRRAIQTLWQGERRRYRLEIETQVLARR